MNPRVIRYLADLSSSFSSPLPVRALFLTIIVSLMTPIITAKLPPNSFQRLRLSNKVFIFLCLFYLAYSIVSSSLYSLLTPSPARLSSLLIISTFSVIHSFHDALLLLTRRSPILSLVPFTPPSLLFILPLQSKIDLLFKMTRANVWTTTGNRLTPLVKFLFCSS